MGDSHQPVHWIRATALSCGVAVLALVMCGCETFPVDRSQMLGLINNERSSAGRHTVVSSGALDRSAEESAVRTRDAWVAAGCPLPAREFLVHTPTWSATTGPNGSTRAGVP